MDLEQKLVQCEQEKEEAYNVIDEQQAENTSLKNMLAEQRAQSASTTSSMSDLIKFVTSLKQELDTLKQQLPNGSALQLAALPPSNVSPVCEVGVAAAGSPALFSPSSSQRSRPQSRAQSRPRSDSNANLTAAAIPPAPSATLPDSPPESSIGSVSGSQIGSRSGSRVGGRVGGLVPPPPLAIPPDGFHPEQYQTQPAANNRGRR